MEATIKEIAGLLRSTEQMAAQFVERVQTRSGQSVSQAEILAVMQKMSAKTLSMEKVVTKVQQRKPASSGASRRRTERKPSQMTTERKGAAEAATTTLSPTALTKAPQTTLGKLASVLRENWDRAEKEGLQPNRMSAEAFLDAIYQYTDRREGTRRRILQAARQLDQADIILTPPLVADTVHDLFAG